MLKQIVCYYYTFSPGRFCLCVLLVKNTIPFRNINRYIFKWFVVVHSTHCDFSVHVSLGRLDLDLDLDCNLYAWKK